MPMLAHLVIEFVDTAATAGVAWVLYFLYRRRSEERLKLVSAGFLALFIGSAVHVLLSTETITVPSFWVGQLTRLVGGAVLMTAATIPAEFFKNPARVSATLWISFTGLAAGLLAAFLLPGLDNMPAATRLRLDILEIVPFAVSAVGFYYHPVLKEHGADLLLSGALGALAFSRLSFLGRAAVFDTFFFLGHFVRLVADSMLLAYVFFFSVRSEKALNQALRDSENRYRDLLSLITTTELAASSLDLTTTLMRICRELTLDLNFERCCVVLCEKDSGDSSIAAYYNRDENTSAPPLHLSCEEYPNLRKVVGKGIISEIPDLGREPLTSFEEGLLGTGGALLLIPLVVETKFLGALYFQRAKPGRFSPDLVRLCQTAAMVAAMAIRKAVDYEELRAAYVGTVNALVKSIDAMSPYTKGHSERSAHYAEMLGKALNMGKERLDRLKLAALLHDVGKLAISGDLLAKPGVLTSLEWDEMKRHPRVGADIISQAPQLMDITPMVRWHHERVDGTGYPDGLRGESIPLEARIMSIADAFDAMTSDRPYRPGMTEEAALEELRRNAGTQFDPELVEVFIKKVRKVKHLNDEKKQEIG